jgi:hypothetical protein
MSMSAITFSECGGGVVVLWGGVRFTGWVVAGQDGAGGVAFEGVADDFAGWIGGEIPKIGGEDECSFVVAGEDDCAGVGEIHARRPVFGFVEDMAGLSRSNGHDIHS